MALNLRAVIHFVMTGDSRALRGAQDASVGGFQRMESAAENFGKNAERAFTQVAGAWTTLLVARQVAGFVGSIIQPAMELDEGLARLGAESALTSEEMDRLKDAALRAAAATTFTPTEAIEGMRTLRRAGLDVGTAYEAIVPVMQLAQVGAREGLDVAQTARVAGKLFQELGMNANRIRLSFDQLLVASQAMGFSLQNSEDVVAKLGIASARTDQSFSELLITFGLARRSMASSRLTASELSRVVDELADPDKRAALAQAFGVGVIEEGTGRLRNLNDIMLEIAQHPLPVENFEQFQTRLRGTGISVAALRVINANLLALERGMRGANGQMMSGTETLAEMRRRLNEADGALSTMSERILQAFGPATEELKETFTAFVAEAVAPMLREMVPLIQVLTTAVSGLMKALDTPIVGTVIRGFFRLLTVGGGLGAGILFVAGSMRLLRVALDFTARTLGFRYGPAAAQAAAATEALTIAATPAALGVSNLGNAAAASAGKLSSAKTAAVGLVSTLLIVPFVIDLIVDAFALLLEGLAKLDEQFEAPLARIRRLQEVGLIEFLKEGSGLFEETGEAAATAGEDFGDFEQHLAQIAEGMEDAETAQRGMTSALSDYLDTVRKTKIDQFPPRFYRRDLDLVRQGIERFAESHQDAAGEQATSLMRTRWQAIQETLASVNDVSELTASQTAQLEEDYRVLALALRALGPGYDRFAEGAIRGTQAAERLTSPENLAATALLAGAGFPGFEGVRPLGPPVGETLAAGTGRAGRAAFPQLPVGIDEETERMLAPPARPVRKATESEEVAQISRGLGGPLGLGLSALGALRTASPLNQRASERNLRALDGVTRAITALTTSLREGLTGREVPNRPRP